MRALQRDLQARLDEGATRLCRCWHVRRADGVTLGFTDHDTDLGFDGMTFRASSGMDASALQAATGLNVDNAQAIGALSDAAIREGDIRAGKFDHAEIHHWLVDWERIDLRILMFRGHFGEIRRADGAFEVELRGLSEALNVPVGRSILRTCDRILGDAKCGVDLERADLTAIGTALEGSAGTRIFVAALGGFGKGWFARGELFWVSGHNTDTRATVKADSIGHAGVRILDLWQQPTEAIRAGDRFRIVAGCDKRSETCRAKFSNFINFRGFPHIPGDDWVTVYPKDGEVHDGSSQN